MTHNKQCAQTLRIKLPAEALEAAKPAKRPKQNAVIVSGYAESPRVTLAQTLGAGACLRKPVTLEKLSKAARQELDRI